MSALLPSACVFRSLGLGGKEDARGPPSSTCSPLNRLIASGLCHACGNDTHPAPGKCCENSGNKDDALAIHISTFPGALYIAQRYLLNLSLELVCFDPFPHLLRALGNGFGHKASASTQNLQPRGTQRRCLQGNRWPSHPRGTVSKITRSLVTSNLITQEALPKNKKEKVFRLTPLGKELFSETSRTPSISRGRSQQEP